MKKLFHSLFLIICINTYAQTNYRFAFYNFENLFDVVDDPETRDEEFTPEGPRHWNNYKYYRKLDQLARVVSLMGDWSALDALGFCEVEHQSCIEDLLQREPLIREKFGIVYEESDDRRGIDVGFIYNKRVFKEIYHQKIEVRTNDEPDFRTRDILLVQLNALESNDSIYFLINHWPSKYRGKLESEHLRILASKRLSESINELLEKNKNAKIIVMGDFNDTREERSIQLLEESTGLINVFSDYKASIKSHKYQAEWSLIDQIFITPRVSVEFDIKKFVYEAEFLLEPDEKFLGQKPRRSFTGMSYNADGFSDHLPVFIDLVRRQP